MKYDYANYFLKDSRGFTWISSVNGLYRYDGQKFKLFTHDSRDKHSIPNNYVNYIVEDRDGNIWVSHGKGVSRLNINSGKFTNFLDGDGTNNTLRNSAISQLVIDKHGVLFNSAVTLDQIRYFDPKQDKFIVAPIDTTNDGFNKPGVGSDIVGNLIFMPSDSSTYMASANGLFEIDTKSFKRKRITNQPFYDPIDVFKDHSGKIWLGEWGGGLSLIDHKSKRNIIKDRRILNFREYKDAKGKYWLFMVDLKYGSLIILDPETEKYTETRVKIENEIAAIFTPGYFQFDNSGKLTIASPNGLIESNEIQKNIKKSFTYTLGQMTDLYYENLVRSFIQLDNGDYMIGLHSHCGICILDKDLNIKSIIKTYRYNGKTYDLDVKNFYRLGPNKYVLSGTTGIAMMENSAIRPIQYVPNVTVNPIDHKYAYARDFLHKVGSEYWVRTLNGELKIFDFKTNTFTRNYTYTNAGKSTKIEGIRNIIFDCEGILWVQNLTSMFKHNPSRDEFDLVPIMEKRINQSMYSFIFDSDNHIWITGENGLLKYDLGTKKETFYNEEQGISSDQTQRVIADEMNNIWFTTRNGLSVLSQKTGTVKNYDSKDGLPMNYNEYHGVFTNDNNGNIIFGNSGVVTRINTQNLLNINDENPKVVITSVIGSDGTANINIDKFLTKNVTLQFKNFPVNVLFSIIDYSSNGERTYFYRYSGQDTTWLQSDEGIVPINTIEPGDYTIQVRGKVNSVYTNIDTLNFTIIAFWHQTKAFKYMSILSILSLIGGLINWRLNTIRKNARQEAQIQKLAAEQYRNQLELSQISNYFSTSLQYIDTVDAVLWDVARNLIGQLNYVDCMIYLWNDDNTKLVQKAAFGPKGSIDLIDKQVFEVAPGQGVVGHVVQTKEPVLIKDTRLDSRYRADEMVRLSEICVPIMQGEELIGIIDSEHHNAGHFTENDVLILQTISSNIAAKINDLKTKKELATTINNLKGAQLDALRSQMNPHFIFNSLNSIENFILKNERLIASEYLGKFSKLIRNILDNSKSEKISIQQEIETLKLYIDLERLRSDHAFDAVFDIPDAILDDNIMVPPMLMQPHVENAILHGIRLMSDRKGIIAVSLELINDERLEYILQDNGIGRQQSLNQKDYKNVEHKSHGIDITQNRIELYNQKYNTQITMTIEDLHEQGSPLGTKITISIPLI